ncbi:MAG: AmmeMemoRadiSam system protein B [Candidatus Methanomethylophilaceae archaeon]
MRYPAVAGQFYPMSRDDLISEIRFCFQHGLGPGLPERKGNARSIVGAVSPHAGYRASGMNAAHVFKSIAEDGLPEAYIVIGPDHHGVPFDAVMCSDPYITPLGECKVHQEIAGKLSEYIPDSPNAHRFEHSVEVQVPFIQYIDPDPHIVPIIMRRQDKASAVRLAAAIERCCEGHDVIVIASSDLSHYIPKDHAAKLDRMVLDSISELDVDRMYSVIRDNNISACGYGPIAVSIMASKPSSAEILKYSNSWDSLGTDTEAVVGYGSAVLRR